MQRQECHPNSAYFCMLGRWNEEWLMEMERFGENKTGFCNLLQIEIED